MSALQAARVGDHAKHGFLPEGRDGAGDGEDLPGWQAAEILGISERHMRRWRERYVVEDYNGLFDRRCGKPSSQRVPVATVEKVFALYREQYFDLNVQHFHEKFAGRARRRVELHLGEAGAIGAAIFG